MSSHAAASHCFAQVVAPLLVLLNLTTRDKELGGYVMAGPFRAGIFPPKLPLEAQVEWWAYLWRQGGEWLGAGLYKRGVGEAAVGRMLCK